MSGQRPSREEFESSLEFIAALQNGDLSEVSGAGRSKEDRSLLAHELLSAAEDATHPSEMIPHLLRAVRLDPACLDARMLLALAFRDFASNAQKIGNLTITSEILEQILNSK